MDAQTRALETKAVWIPVMIAEGAVRSYRFPFLECASSSKADAWDNLVDIHDQIAQLPNISRAGKIALLRRRGYRLLRGTISLDP